MLLSEYQAQLSTVIDRYSRTDLLVSCEISTDSRTPKIGIIKGKLTFADGTQFFFTEYVDVRYRLEKLSYSYHYQGPNGDLIFRYDNAVHKPKLLFSFHKHLVSGEICEAEPPELEFVIC
jgi:hypothetical protein